MPPVVAAVVWDMDGTLLDSVDAIAAAFATVAGRPPIPPAEVERLFRLPTPAAILTDLTGTGAGPDEVDAFYAALAVEAERVEPYPGVHEVLAALAGRIPTGVFTGSNAVATGILLRATGLHDLLDTVVAGDDVTRRKPHPDGLELACRRLGVPPAAALYVGDTDSDLTTAVNAGAVPVAAAWGHNHRPGAVGAAVCARPADVLALVDAGTDRPTRAARS